VIVGQQFYLFRKPAWAEGPHLASAESARSDSETGGNHHWVALRVQVPGLLTFKFKLNRWEFRVQSPADPAGRATGTGMRVTAAVIFAIAIRLVHHDKTARVCCLGDSVTLNSDPTAAAAGPGPG
jgi:hypothetical protein